MKRAFLAFALSLFLAAAVHAAAPVVKTINGNPLTVNIGDDTSFQILDVSVPGSGQIYPSDCTTGTADMGVFVRSSGTLVTPNFPEHSCATATGFVSNAVWTPVSISDVTGTGTASDPFIVVVTDSAASLGLTLTMTVTYINGQNYFLANLSLDATSPATVDVYLAGDIYLANSDFGVPYRIPASGAVGGQDCSTPPTYTILFVPLTSADDYTATFFATLWGEIQSGDLNNTVDTGCEDDSAGLEWAGRSVAPGSSLNILTAATFGTIPGIAQCAAPGPPGNPEIHVTADPTLPVTATDYVTYGWDPPGSGGAPDGYQYQINSDTPQRTTDTTVDFQGPLGLRPDAPVTLSVLAYACSPEQDSPVAASQPYSLAPPVASFSASATTIPAGQSVTFTDTSSPQATSWLWFFGTTGQSTDNNPTFTFSSAGAYTVFLVATNGSGSSVSAPQTILVTSGAAGPNPASRRHAVPIRTVRLAGQGSSRASAPGEPRRQWDLGSLLLARTNQYWLTLRSRTDTIAYVRIERDGTLLAERRLEVLAGPPTIVDLGAYPGWDHSLPVGVRVVAEEPVAAALEVEE